MNNNPKHETKRWSVWTCHTSPGGLVAWVRRGIYEDHAVALRVKETYDAIDGVTAQIREGTGLDN